MTDNISALGFNGEYLDDTLDNYHLGNGYRAYNPSIMAFTAPDDMSPFGHGGINPYMYVSGDPINNTDPTGHFAGFLGAIIGIINMVSPLQVPTSLSVAGIEEAAIGTGINLGVDLATDGLGAVATPAIETMDAAFKTIIDDAILESQKEIEDEKMHNILNGVLDLQQEREIVEPPLQHNSPEFNELVHHDAPGPSRGPYNKEKPLQRIKKSVMEAKNGDEFQQFITTGRAPETKGKEVHAFVFTHEQKRYISSGSRTKGEHNFFTHTSRSTLVKEGSLLEVRGEEWARRYRADGRFLKPKNNYANTGSITVFSDLS